MGGPSKATQEQQSVDLQSSEQQQAFNTQLMSLFTQQFSSQQSVLSFLTSTVMPMMTNAAAGQGYTTDQLAAMRTSATDTNAQQFQNAQAALNNQVSQASGGSKLTGVSGAVAESDAALLNAEAQTQSASQNQITEANAQQALTNFWNGANVLSGASAQMNPLGYASVATGGSGAIASLSGSQASLQNSITNANNSSFLGSIEKGFGASLGGTIGGGASNFLGGLPGVGGYF